jgi:polar amino acid transport system substrate-binding protein
MMLCILLEPAFSLPMKRLLLALAVLCLIPQCKRSDALIIGTDATYPPFEFKSETGELAGVSIDMGKALGEYLGRPVEFRNIAFDGLITALQTRSIDIIISSMTANDERRKSLNFSAPYVTTGICLLLPKNSSIAKVDDLKQGKRRIVTKIATTGEQWSRANLPNAEIVALDSDPACVLEISKGSADAWVYDQISVMNYALANPDTTKALLAPIRIEEWAVGLRHGEDELRDKISAFIAKFRAEGSFDKVAVKYLAKERDYMKQQNLPFVFELSATPGGH